VPTKKVKAAWISMAAAAAGMLLAGLGAVIAGGKSDDVL